MKKIHRNKSLKLKSDNLISSGELINFRGGLGGWDGRCGIKTDSGWLCGTEEEGYSYDGVNSAFNTGANVTAWCCASCGDTEKCGELSIAQA